MPSTADRIADMNTTAGFLQPVYEEDPLPGREPVYALTPDDMEKVRTGYACPGCLADFGGLYRPRCPMCGHQRNVNLDFGEPPWLWVQHQRELQADGPVTRTRARAADEAIRAVMNDPDVEHATMRSLMPRRFGRGRP